MDAKKMLKMALIAGASHALQYKREHPHASDEEAIQQVNRESGKIVTKLGSDE